MARERAKPKKSTGKRFLTKHHPPPKEGWKGRRKPKKGEQQSDAARKELMKWRAMELHIEGKSLRAIAIQLAEDFELIDTPNFSTVSGWLDEALGEVMSARQADAEKHCQVLFMRAEEMISELLPLARGNMVVSRKRRMDGEEIQILDEEAIKERLAAMAELRKYMEMEAKLLKIGRVGEEQAGNQQLNGHNLTLLVERMVTTHISFPGAAAKDVPTLTLASGDVDVDRMDSESLAMEG